MASKKKIAAAGAANSNKDERLVDITAFVIDCAERYLTVREPFLSDMDENDDESAFNLHDAMAASQLMDRKMDCCEIPAALIAPWHSDGGNGNGPDRMIYPRPVPSGIDDPMAPLPWNDLTVAEAAFVCLEILVRLQSLLSGSSVGESTFTCLYAHSAVLADMKVRLLPHGGCSASLVERMQGLRVQDDHSTPAQWSVFGCALALVEITESVRGIILSADIYEEEDFSSNTHSLQFFTTHNTTSTSNGKSSKDDNDLLDTAEVLRMALHSLEEFPASDDVAAIQLVLGYQSHFLSILSSLARLAGTDLYRTVIAAQAAVRTAVQTLNELQHVVTKLVGDDKDYAPEIQSLLRQAFDSFVNRPLVGNLPIRKISFQRPANAIPILVTVTSEIDTCVCNLLLRGTSLGRIQRMLDRVSPANILSRSLILLNMYFDDRLLGKYELRELLSNHMAQWQAADPATTELASVHAGAFLSRLAKPIYDTLKVRILNRNRQRSYIEAVMLPEWVSLQNEAHSVDLHCCHRQTAPESRSGGPPSTYFTRYVLTVMIRLMDLYVASGVEVGLFLNSHHDLSFAYWYRDFLLSALNQNLSAMRQTKEVVEANIAAPRSSADANPTKPRGKKKHHQKNKVASNGKNGHAAIDPRPPSAEDLEDCYELKTIAVKRNMCRKTIQFLAALKQAGVLREQQFEFTSLERIFEMRFEVFGAIRQPPPLTYRHFLEGNDFSRVPLSDLLQTVTEGFQYCRASIEQILQDAAQQKLDPSYAAVPEGELRALIKVCIGNSVYVQKLRQIVESGEAAKAKAVFDFDSNKQFCIIKVSS